MKNPTKTILDFPKLAKEWDYDKNSGIDISKISYGSSRKIFWKCDSGHSWLAKMNNRTAQKSGCPYCSGKFVSKDNCLATRMPDLLKLWDYGKNRIKPTEITLSSHTKVWWRCKNNHSWQETSNKMSLGRGCPFCSGKRVCVDNCLYFTHYDLCDEWNYNKNKQDINPLTISKGCKTNVWWQCSCGCEWQVSPNSRTNNNTGCPLCKESHGEKRIRLFLDKQKLKYQAQYRISECRYKRSLPFDFMIEIDNRYFLLEYHGEQHWRKYSFGSKSSSIIQLEEKFKKIQKRDKIKTKYCKKHHIPLLVISFKNFEKIESIILDFIRKVKEVV